MPSRDLFGYFRRTEAEFASRVTRIIAGVHRRQNPLKNHCRHSVKQSINGVHWHSVVALIWHSTYQLSNLMSSSGLFALLSAFNLSAWGYSFKTCSYWSHVPCVKNLAVAFPVAMLLVRGLKFRGELTDEHKFIRRAVARSSVLYFIGLPSLSFRLRGTFGWKLILGHYKVMFFVIYLVDIVY